MYRQAHIAHHRSPIKFVSKIEQLVIERNPTAASDHQEISQIDARNSEDHNLNLQIPHRSVSPGRNFDLIERIGGQFLRSEALISRTWTINETGQSWYRSRDLGEERADPRSNRGFGAKACGDRDRDRAFGRGKFWSTNRVLFSADLFI